MWSVRTAVTGRQNTRRDQWWIVADGEGTVVDRVGEVYHTSPDYEEERRRMQARAERIAQTYNQHEPLVTALGECEALLGQLQDSMDDPERLQTILSEIHSGEVIVRARRTLADLARSRNDVREKEAA